MKRLLALALSFVSCTGCASMRRHPAVYGIAIGGAAGVTVGILTRRGTCPTVINGYPYNGTPPCPGPNYDPGFKRK